MLFRSRSSFSCVEESAFVLTSPHLSYHDHGAEEKKRKEKRREEKRREEKRGEQKRGEERREVERMGKCQRRLIKLKSNMG